MTRPNLMSKLEVCPDNEMQRYPKTDPERIAKWLNDQEVSYRRLSHAPTRTSADSAEGRGEPLENGAKALLVRADAHFVLMVMSAVRRLDSTRAKAVLAAKSIRFATVDELLEQTGLEPGSVPPFGRPVLPFSLYIDQSVHSLERVAFNAGSLTESFTMDAKDYVQVANPIALAEFAH